MKVNELQSPLHPQNRTENLNKMDEMLDNIPSPQRKPSNYKRAPLRQQSLLLELRKIENEDNINPIKEEDDS